MCSWLTFPGSAVVVGGVHKRQHHGSLDLVAGSWPSHSPFPVYLLLSATVEDAHESRF